MSLSKEQVHHIARLARIAVSDDDVEQFAGQLSSLLDHFSTLSAVDTEGVEPTAHPLPLGNVMRADEPAPSLPLEEVLANAPEHEDGYLRVRAVLE